ncbi:phosphotransferase enzyme family protein [Bacteroides sp. 224]|uniref:phosphotransferase enzyme family protein n=1 Tax=Bacteroides sp. 224 TaxID=2302936 RepID=UPI0013D211BA|nr:aminoglycoside phosphotransferase family protein [Bacteroides sp. 224]NDV67095.1 aminoglycoside phosphotransferase family protein [Bacteroides sp. 224]
MNNLTDVVSRFAIEGNVSEVKPLGSGLINDSFRVINADTNAPDYVLQRINHAIFQDVDMLMNNIVAVTSHIRKKLEKKGEKDIDRKVLTFIPAKEGGKYYWFDGENYWRLMVFIKGTITCETVNPEYSYYAGVAFGSFQSMLADIPDELGESIPNFHNMEFRLSQLREAVANNVAGRLDEAQYYVDELEKRADEMCKAEQLYREGKLPKRVCHCDTKVNNMLFDESGNVLCVIDLDTVMPNFVFSDIGDFLRTAANTGAEDDENLDRVSFNMEIFKAFAKGYLESGKSFLTPIEIENLPYAATLFPYMQTVRFLADYLNGDTYYKINYPTHNLVRTAAQFKLLRSTESYLQEMKEFIEHGDTEIPSF